MTTPPIKGETLYENPTIGNQQVFDDQFYPILMSATRGPLTMEMMKECFYVGRDPILEYAKANNHRIVIISSISDMKAPDAIVRKELAELGKHKDEPYKDTLLATVLIVSNALMRGVVTAISWLAKDDMVPNLPVPDLKAAAMEATKLLINAGMSNIPAVPDDYEFNRGNWKK